METSTTTVTLFTRHAPECSQKGNPQWKRCKCRKSLYIYFDGRVSYKSAKTRSWEQAEKVAQAERDARDPAKIELAKIEAQKAEIAAKKAAKDCRLEDALVQWIAGQKRPGKETLKSYETFGRKMLTWAASKSIVNLSDVTPDALDGWVASWQDARTTQGMRVSRIKSFFTWACQLKKVADNPAVVLRAIRSNSDDAEETKPLTSAQFQELIGATYRYDVDRRVEKDRFGTELRAIFLTQRWTGLRLSDVLMLPRSRVVGNRIAIKMQKTGDQFQQVVPVAVI
jgi:integrase